MSDNRATKKQKILDCALRIMREQGDAGLTMRKIAECAGMRLSNLQYYFKSKDDVLAAMVTAYFDACEAELKQVAASSASLGARERTHRLVTEVLHHGMELSDMCRVFRELWAIATRNEVVRDEMNRYYKALCVVIADSVLGEKGDAGQKQRVSSLLLPYIEGYSITALALPMPMDDVADMLTDLTLSVVDRD